MLVRLSRVPRVSGPAVRYHSALAPTAYRSARRCDLVRLVASGPHWLSTQTRCL